MVPGQVENYVLIINLDDAGWSDKSVLIFLYSQSKSCFRLHPTHTEADYLQAIY